MSFSIKNIICALYLVISWKTYGQVCEDSVQLFGLYTNEPFVNHSTGLTRLTNGNYAYLAWPLSTEANGHSGIVITNADGQFIKGKSFTSTGYSLNIYKIAAAPNGGIIMLGSLHSVLYTRNDLLVLKLDNQLNILWSKRVKVNNSDPATIDANYIEWAIHCDSGGAIFFSFYSEDFPSNNALSAAFIAMNTQGNIVWSKSFEPSWLAPGSGYKVDGITSIGNNVFFIGKVQTSGNPGFIALSFNRLTGNYDKINRVTHSDPGYSISFNIQEIDNVSLFPSQKDFYFAFEARNSINQTTTLYHFLIDSLLQCNSLRKIRNVKYGNPTSSQFGLSQNGELAFTGGRWGASDEANCLAVIDREGNILISKKLGTSFFQRPDIRPVLITDSGQRVTFSVTNFPARDSIIKFDVPLLGDSSLYNCVGKDTVFFSVESAAIQQQIIPSPVFYSDMISAFDLQVSSADFTLAKQEYCKVKSICSNINLSGNSSFCTGNIQTFTVNKNLQCLKNIRWNYDSIPALLMAKTDSSISLRFDNPWQGNIIASIQDCTLADTIFVQVNESLPPFTLGLDKILCHGDTTTLSAPLGYLNYSWSTGHTTPTINISIAGTYYIRCKDVCGNVFSDTIDIKNPDIAFPNMLDQQICKHDSFYLFKLQGFSSYTWNPQVSKINDTLYFINPDVTTQYNLTTQDSFGCVWNRNFTIAVQQCADQIWFPSGFTPNKDGLNDDFGPVSDGRLQFFSFKIYNRWGEVVFASLNPLQKWNGKFKGFDASAGVYVWVCNYQFRNAKAVMKKGSVVLIR